MRQESLHRLLNICRDLRECLQAGTGKASSCERSSQGLQKSEELTLSCLTVEAGEKFCVLFSSGLTATGEYGGDKAFLGTQMH